MANVQEEGSSILSLRRYLQRRERGLALVGAVLVFTTFVVKEALRDHYKDIEDALGAARGVFLIREDLSHLQQGLQSVRVDEQITRAVVQKQKNPYLAVINAPHLVDDIGYNLARWNTVLETISDLLGSVPHRPDADFTAASLRGRLQAADKQNHDYSRSMAQMYLSSKSVDKAEGKNVNDGVFKLNEEVGDVAKDIDKFANDTLTAAQQEDLVSERRYRICTFIGYFTFGFGWLLAFIGRLAGIAGLGE
jgi:hypothetical protein